MEEERCANSQDEQTCEHEDSPCKWEDYRQDGRYGRCVFDKEVADVLKLVHLCDNGLGCPCKHGVIRDFRGRPYCARKTNLDMLADVAHSQINWKGDNTGNTGNTVKRDMKAIFDFKQNYEAAKRFLYDPQKMKTLGVGVVLGIFDHYLKKIVLLLCDKAVTSQGYKGINGDIKKFHLKSISLTESISALLQNPKKGKTLKTALHYAYQTGAAEEFYRVTLPNMVHDTVFEHLTHNPNAEQFAKFARVLIPSVMQVLNIFGGLNSTAFRYCQIVSMVVSGILKQLMRDIQPDSNWIANMTSRFIQVSIEESLTIQSQTGG